MKTKITKITSDFQPTPKTYSNQKKCGAIPEFVDYELPNMITYFTETEDEKKSWQMTCQRWMRSAFKGKAGRDWEYDRDKSRMYRGQVEATPFPPQCQTNSITPEQSLKPSTKLKDIKIINVTPTKTALSHLAEARKLTRSR